MPPAVKTLSRSDQIGLQAETGNPLEEYLEDSNINFGSSETLENFRVKQLVLCKAAT